MAAESFPKLKQLLQHLRSGLMNFGLNEIYMLLRDYRDREFLKKAKGQLKFLREAITEIQRKCIDLQRTPDSGHIKFLLWRAIFRASRHSRGTLGDAEQIGISIVTQLHSLNDQRLICIPLFGSVAPWKKPKKNPKMYHLANGVWLLEPSMSIECLLVQLEGLLGNLPEEIAEQLKGIEDPMDSEYGALLYEPLIVLHYKGFFARNEYVITRFGIPLIALHNVVAINRLDSSDNLNLGGWMTKLDPPDWPDDLQVEWFSLHDPDFPFTLPNERVSIAVKSKGVAEYEFNCSLKALIRFLRDPRLDRTYLLF